ncbi:hypothetical protein PC119_g40 [Phytophthora cactorum]|nr:hypothetical protein PC119_g40 [Phytophthora cactorum]KAG3106409.1 hypothetical protein PC122_g406 [Phytophthora cactorum]
MLVEQNELNGWHIALHVGAASGDFIAPFINPELQWDFRLPNVKSINVSGHKFGLGGRCTGCYALVDTDFFNIVDKAHMPLVAFSLKDSSAYTCFDKLKGRDDHARGGQAELLVPNG